MRHGSASSSRRQRNNRSARRGSGGGNGGNSRSQVFDSNGPDVRIRGTANQVAEKYDALAKDAAGAGDLILAESYLQHAEHYVRIMGSWDDRGSYQAPAVAGEAVVESLEEENSSEETAERFVSKKPAARPAQDDLGLPSSLFGAPARDGVDA